MVVSVWPHHRFVSRGFFFCFVFFFLCRLIREKVEKNEFTDIKEIIVILQKDFTLSTNPNSRKGGLMGLAATAIALGKVSILLYYCAIFSSCY